MPVTIDRRATRVVRRLHHDREFMRRFRTAPHEVLDAAGLTPSQAGAILSGRATDLAAAGIDPRRVGRMPLGMRLRARTLFVLAATTSLLAGPLLSSPAHGLRETAFGIRYIRADARRLRASSPRQIAGRRFARSTIRDVRFVLLPGGCEKGCIEVELIP